MHDEQQRIARQLSYIHCWFKGHEESAEMWKVFCSDGAGVCIKSTTKLLLNSLCREWPHDLILQMHECPYTDCTVQTPEFLPNTASVRKDSHFANQQEVRILAQVDVSKGSAPLPGPDCKLVPVDLDVLLQGLVIGPSIQPENERTIREAIIERGIKANVLNSSPLLPM
jgi:hypothetical protein